MSEPFKLELGKPYLDHVGSFVTIESVIEPDDPLYFQGYRFLGNNGQSYTSAGRINVDAKSLSDLVTEAVTVGYGDIGVAPSRTKEQTSSKLSSSCFHGNENCIRTLDKDLTLYLEAFPDMEMVRLNIPSDHKVLDVEVNIDGYPPITIDISQFLKK